MSSGEIITINIGAGGVRMGQRLNELYCAEHGIDSTAKKLEKTSTNIPNNFFQETDDNTFNPRVLFIDSKADSIDAVQSTTFYLANDYFISGVESSANNFARGYNAVSHALIPEIIDKIRRLVESCDNCSGFFINHSVGAGTGSGLGAKIMEEIKDSKPLKVGFQIYGHLSLSSESVHEPYNELLSAHYSLNNTDCSMVFENQKLHQICQNQLQVAHDINYDNLNRLMIQPISSMTAPLRFENHRLPKLVTGLIPIPRAKYIYGSLSRIRPKNDGTGCEDVKSITKNCLLSENFFVTFDEWNVRRNEYLAMKLIYKGNTSMSEAKSVVQELKIENMSVFNCAPEVITTQQAPTVLQQDDLAICETNVAMIGSNPAISGFFEGKVCERFDVMYKMRAFVHWFIREGLEEAELLEARENLRALIQDYQDILHECTLSDKHYD